MKLDTRIDKCRQAETVRRQWLTQFLACKSPPKGALRFLLTELATGHWVMCQSLGAGSQAAAELLCLDGRSRIAAALATTSDQRAQVIGLASILGAYEEHTSTETWRTPKDCDRRYLAALTDWGYQPSDVEQLVTGQPSQ
jgi:ParB family chromosome partitioning protein